MQTPALRELTTESLKLVWRQQKITTANLSGNAFVLFFLYSWSRVQDRSGQDHVFSLLIAGSVLFAGLWLHATTLATFQRNEEETPFVPALRRMHYYLPWAAAIGGTAALFAWMSSTLSVMVWVAGVGVILALLPMAAQAAGGLFSRKVACDIIFNEKYWLFATGVLVLGLYAPFSLFAWLPAFRGADRPGARDWPSNRTGVRSHGLRLGVTGGVHRAARHAAQGGGDAVAGARHITGCHPSPRIPFPENKV